MQQSGEALVATHGGTWHVDDATGIAIIRLHMRSTYGKTAVLRVLRTRDPEIIETGDWKVDVGGRYEPSRGYHDHHQKDGPARPNGERKSAATLLWEEYGEELILEILGPDRGYDPKLVRRIFDLVDNQLFRAIDAMDTNSVAFSPVVSKTSGAPLEILNLNGLVGLLNPNPDFDDISEAAQMERFWKTVDLCETVLVESIKSAISSILWEERIAEADFGEPIMVLKHISRGSSAPWTRYVSRLGHVQFVVFQTIDLSWRVKPVRGRRSADGRTLALPAEWHSLQEGELRAVCGIPDATFCGEGGWMGGAASKEGALALAKLALEHFETGGATERVIQSEVVKELSVDIPVEREPSMRLPSASIQSVSDSLALSDRLNVA